MTEKARDGDRPQPLRMRQGLAVGFLSWLAAYAFAAALAVCLLYIDQWR